jgi:hypothetical protein
VLDGGAQAGSRAEGVAEQVGTAEVQALDDSGDVVAEALVAEVPIDVAGVAVALQFDGDHPAVHRQPVEQISRHAGQAEAAVHHDHGGATGAAALPVDVEAGDGGVPGAVGVGHLSLLSLCDLIAGTPDAAGANHRRPTPCGAFNLDARSADPSAALPADGVHISSARRHHRRSTDHCG